MKKKEDYYTNPGENKKGNESSATFDSESFMADMSEMYGGVTGSGNSRKGGSAAAIMSNTGNAEAQALKTNELYIDYMDSYNKALASGENMNEWFIDNTKKTKEFRSLSPIIDEFFDSEDSGWFHWGGSDERVDAIGFNASGLDATLNAMANPFSVLGEISGNTAQRGDSTTAPVSGTGVPLATTEDVNKALTQTDKKYPSPTKAVSNSSTYRGI